MPNNHKFRPKRGAFQSAITLLIFMFFSPAAQAVLLQVDHARSEIRSPPTSSYCVVNVFTGELECSESFPAQSFAVTGNIDLSVSQESLQLGTGNPAVARDRVHLKTAGLLTDAEDEEFYLSDASGVLLDGYFETLTVDPCATYVGPGWCIPLSWPGASHGTWDGRTLTWNGVINRPVPFIKFSGPSFNSFSYTIVATTIPEPGTLSLLLFLLPVVFYVGVTRGGHKK